MADIAKGKKKTKPFSGITKYFRDVKAEMKKVVWPTRKQVLNNTAVVIASVIIVGLVIWSLDLGFGKIFEYLIK